MSNEKLAEYVKQWRERNAQAIEEAKQEIRTNGRKRDEKGRFVAHDSKA